MFLIVSSIGQKHITILQLAQKNMETNIVSIVIGAIVLIIALLTLGKASVHRYEYLDILTPHWKQGRDIKKSMEKLKRGWIDGPSFYNDMSLLVSEELVEIDIRYEDFEGYELKIAYYRLSSKGGRKNLDRIAATLLEPLAN